MEWYFLGAYWGSRKEPVEQCTERVLKCFGDLAKCDETFSRWFRTGRSRSEALERKVDFTDEKIKELLLRGRNRRDIGHEIIEELGFSITLWNGAEDTQAIGLRIHCGASSSYVGNSFLIDLPSQAPARDRVVRLELLLCAMRAIVESFEPDWATVMPASLVRTTESLMQKPAVGWLFYAARHLLPSPDIAALRRVDVPGHGSIFVITGEPLNPTRPEHVELRNAFQTEIDRCFGVQ